MYFRISYIVWTIGFALFLSLAALVACRQQAPEASSGEAPSSDAPYLYILGIAQDGGIPQAGDPEHPGWENPGKSRQVVSLGLVDPTGNRQWLFDATPDLPEQVYDLQQQSGIYDSNRPVNGIFLTHAHMGHYTGLMHLGFESAGSDRIPVYAMPNMYQYLANNGPWDQLVKYQNIILNKLRAGHPLMLTGNISVTPIPVPHRQEYSEVVGYRIDGPSKSALFIPDIDSWNEWEEWGTKVEELIKTVDYAFLDGTFYANGEIPGRDMTGFPHPFITHSMNRFNDLPASEKKKIYFIHFNHTNPVVWPGNEERDMVIEAGFNLAREGMIITL